MASVSNATVIDIPVDQMFNLQLPSTPVGSPQTPDSPVFKFSPGSPLFSSSFTPPATPPAAAAQLAPTPTNEKPLAKKVITPSPKSAKPQTAEWRIKWIAAVLGSRKAMIHPFSRETLGWKFAELANTLS
jgi:hypothetical protein